MPCGAVVMGREETFEKSELKTANPLRADAIERAQLLQSSGENDRLSHFTVPHPAAAFRSLVLRASEQKSYLPKRSRVVSRE